MRGRENSKQNRRNICNESHTRARLRISAFFSDPCDKANQIQISRHVTRHVEIKGSRVLWAAPAFFWGARRDLRNLAAGFGPGERVRRDISGRTDARARTRESPDPSTVSVSRVVDRAPPSDRPSRPRSYRKSSHSAESSTLRNFLGINRETSNAGPRSDRARRAHRSEPSARRTGVFAYRGTSH